MSDDNLPEGIMRYEYEELAVEALRRAAQATEASYEPWQYWMAQAQVYATLACQPPHDPS